MDTNYDSDGGLPPRSPLLQAQKINYKPEDSPPPFLPEKSSSTTPKQAPDSGSGQTKKSGKKRRKKAQPSQGDAVLIGYLAPNRPDIARVAGEAPLNPDSESESGGPDNEEEMGDRSNPAFNNQTSEIPASTKMARGPLTLINSQLDGPDQGEALHHGGPRETGSINAKGVDNERTKMEGVEPTNASDINAAISIQADTASKGRRTPNIETPSEISDKESVATSPNLRQYRISAAEGPPEQTLPAIQMSPPRSASAASPNGSRSLPSLRIALAEPESRDLDVPMNGTSPAVRTDCFPTTIQFPSLNRRPYIPQSISASSPDGQLSPPSGKEMSGISPPGSTHQSPFQSSEPNTPYTLAITISDQQPTTQLTEGSSACPTPIEYRMNVGNEKPQSLNGPLQPNGRLISSGFKCAQANCTAPLFQTQYLLNSHANVHSQSRPHYCPVEDCSRGIGGKGFKRKNEMIRHRLVHDSPGYICPLCPEQQRRYPRPDNLQRHVRTHHGDKDRDDPQLREVLAQRPEGGSKGRRRISWT